MMINGRYYSGPTDYPSLESITKIIQLEDQQFTICPPMTVDPAKSDEATIHTEAGDIVVELFPDVAPIAVNSLYLLSRKRLVRRRYFSPGNSRFRGSGW